MCVCASCAPQMDAVNRSCVVSAHFGSHRVHLVVKFPAQYPNNAAPTFQFVPPTTIPSAMKTKIHKVAAVCRNRARPACWMLDALSNRPCLLRSSPTRRCRR